MEQGGILKKVADKTTPIPRGTGNFTGFENSTATATAKTDKGNIAFLGRGQDGQEGIYKRVGSTLFKVVDKNTPIPGGSGNFTGFSTGFTISNGNVTFTASGDDGQGGIYKEVDGRLFKVADKHTLIPEGHGTFEDFFRSTASISGKWVVFNGRDSSRRMGVYTDYLGRLHKVIDENDTLEDKTFYGVSAAKESFDEGCIVIAASFDDDSHGLYIGRPAALPIPAVTPWGLAVFMVLVGGVAYRAIGKLKTEHHVKD